MWAFDNFQRVAGFGLRVFIGLGDPDLNFH
jgi:hypothetical protein